ncbi:MAG TPA: hypothetical protein VIG90_04780 [Pedomonas sp.]|uniref:hypothetical protein n=1 Tax=Pedomonas sp. TaxID=2976421 RepID=UPI002F3EF0B1
MQFAAGDDLENPDGRLALEQLKVGRDQPQRGENLGKGCLKLEQFHNLWGGREINSGDAAYVGGWV